jgi:hypothetical protein
MEVLPAKALSGGHPVTDKLHEPGVPSLSELGNSWDLLKRWCPVVKALAEKDLHTSHEGQLGSVEQASVACPSAD